MKQLHERIILSFLLSFSIGAGHALATIPPFWSEHFENGFPSAWNRSDLSGQNVLWEYCDAYFDCPPSSFTFIECNDRRFESPTVEDGYLFVNSLEHGNLSSPHEAVLASPTINCSGKDRVFLQFYTYISALNFNPRQNAIVQVKAGTGDWQSFTIFPNLDISIAERRESWNPRQVLLDISEVAANEAEVQIRWKWKGNGELFWVLDDVALFDESPLNERAIWGNQPGEGDFGDGLNGWTVSNVIDTCRWVWDADGAVYFPDANPKADFWPCSPSAYNGVAMMNPTWCIPLGGPSPFSRSDLVSPIIDLSAIGTGKRLSLNFFQAFMKGNAESVNFPLTSVLFSSDGGQSWQDTIAVNEKEAFSDPVCGEMSISVPDIYIGVPSFRFKFVFSGSSFFWVVDDVRILEKEDDDMAIVPGFVAVAPNFTTPASMVIPIGFAADIRNEGNAVQEGVVAHVQVQHNELEEPIYEDSLEVGALGPGDVFENDQFPGLYTPPPLPSEYVVRYSVSGTQPDKNPADNSKTVYFNVSEDYFAKDPGDCAVNGFFAASEDLRYEIGNCYFVAHGNGFCARDLAFAFRDAVQLEGTDLTIQLYQWKKGDSWGDMNNDTIANKEEYQLLAFNTYTITGLENGNLVKVPVSFDSECISLEDSTYYFVTVGYPEPAFVNGQLQPFFIGASEEVDFTAMFWLSYQLGLPQFVSMLRIGEDDHFRANGWGLLRVPVVRMYVEVANAVNEAEHKEAFPMKIQPNPASDQILVSLPQGLSIVNGAFQIYDYSGHLLQSQALESPFVSNLPVDIKLLPDGCFILRLVSDNQTLHERFVVQRH